MERGVERKTRFFHCFDEIPEVFLVFQDMIREVVRHVAHPLEFGTAIAHDATVLALRVLMDLLVGRIEEIRAPHVPTVDLVVLRQEMLVIMFVGHRLLTEGARGEIGASDKMRRAINDTEQCPTATGGHAVLALGLDVPVELVLCPLETATLVRVETVIVSALVDGHVHEILFIGVLRLVYFFGVRLGRTEDTLDAGATLRERLVEIQVRPRAQRTDAKSGMTPRLSSRTRARKAREKDGTPNVVLADEALDFLHGFSVVI